MITTCIKLSRTNSLDGHFEILYYFAHLTSFYFADKSLFKLVHGLQDLNYDDTESNLGSRKKNRLHHKEAKHYIIVCLFLDTHTSLQVFDTPAARTLDGRYVGWKHGVIAIPFGLDNISELSANSDSKT